MGLLRLSNQGGRFVFVQGNKISCYFIKRYYGHGISKAMADLFTEQQLNKITKIAFEILFWQEYSSEGELRESLFGLVEVEAKRIKSDIEIAPIKQSLKKIYSKFWDFEKSIKWAIALHDEIDGYADALTKLDKYGIQLKEQNNDLAVSIVTRIYNACLEKFIGLSKKSTAPPSLDLNLFVE